MNRTLPGDGQAVAPRSSPRCPACGATGPGVASQTVAALTRGRAAPQHRYRLCRDAACPVVYFDVNGDHIDAHEISVDPGFKGNGRGLVCYCFAHRRDEIENEVAARGRSEILASIEREVRNGRCACARRNPSGKCCLAEVRAIVAARDENGAAT